MSAIDKDPKSKVSKPSGKKFRLGFKDGFLGGNLALFMAILSDNEKRREK
jgi:hypothetical protein